MWKSQFSPLHSMGQGQGSESRYTTVVRRVLPNTTIEIEIQLGVDFTILLS